jgi:hypothetical protein
MPVVWAEAFTGGPAFRSTPASLKARGDWALSEGANQFVLHVYIHQPWEDRRPGMNAWFGTEFNRHNTWFNLSKAWIDYHRRCSVMLQAGKPVADVAYFIGEDAPKMTGPSKPELPAGYDFDYINADVIENRLRVEQGRFVLPDGVSYRLLVLPESETMRPALLQKLTELAAAGGAMLGGPPPKRSPSMQNYPACDAKVQQLADELWDSGKVMQGIGVQEALDRLDTPPDVICPDGILWKHRRDDKTDIYFLANQRSWFRTETITFRVHDRAPELWWPETARIEHPAAYRTGAGTVQTPIHFGPHTSVFVVFRRPAAPDRVVDVTRNGQPMFDWRQAKAGSPSTAPGTFTMAVWAKPEADTTLLPEANAGIRGMREQRNDAFPAPHGDLFVPGGSHAGAGIAIGRNGVAVFEHGASYFAPVLVHAAALTEWTHVAVVYHEGRPRLFLDGVLVREGLQSNYIVHSGVTVDGGNPEFAGELGGSRSLPRAVDAQEVRALMKSMPRRVAEPMHPPIELMRGPNGDIVPRIYAAGRYAWMTADGREHQVDVAEVPAPVEIAGPWTVTFDPRNGGPAEPVPFAELVDWTRCEEEAIRHYSGMATYRTTFDLAAGSQPRWLDLGDVRFLARVRLNGHHVGTVWKSPYRVDISEAVRSGANTLEIDVVNTWLNRLLGDDQRPVAERRTWATRRTWHGSPLPSGLLGPVCLTSFEK